MANRLLLWVIVFAFGCDSLLAQFPRPLKPIAAKLEPTRSVVYKRIADRELKLDLFEPDGHEADHRRGAFLAIHGGGWTSGSARTMYPFAEYFSRFGMVGISLEYRLMSVEAGVTVFDCVKDGRSAVRYLRSHAAELGIDPNKIAVAGGSAGGHIAAATALFDGIDEASDDKSVSCRPDALVLYYPVIDTSERGYGQKKIGTRWKELSPLDHVRANVPPTIIFHGTADKVTPFEGAAQFQKRMQQHGNTCELISHKDGRHGYLIFDLKLYEQSVGRTREFLRSHRMIE